MRDDHCHPRSAPRQGLTLEEVAARCEPPTTAVTIGRLEMGTRTVSVEVAQLYRRRARCGQRRPGQLSERPEIRWRPCSRTAGPGPAPTGGGGAPAAERPGHGGGSGGGRIWRTPSRGRTRSGAHAYAPDGFAGALNRDVQSVPRPPGASCSWAADRARGGRTSTHLLPLGAGGLQVGGADPPLERPEVESAWSRPALNSTLRSAA